MPNYEDVIALVNSIFARHDPYNHHMPRTAGSIMRLAKAMNFKHFEIEMMVRGAALHDIGKINVDPHVLNLPRKYSAAERASVKVHPVEGMKILDGLGYDAIIMDMVMHHHERLDGSGYPDRLRGDEISIYCKTLAVVDVYDALTSRRSYRPAFSQTAALEILQGEAGIKLEAEIVEKFIRLLDAEKN